MKTKLSLLLILTFGFVLSASAGLICEPLGNHNWVCEAPYTENIQSYSWSTGSHSPISYVYCGFGNNYKHVSVTITYTNGTTSTLARNFNCNSGNF